MSQKIDPSSESAAGLEACLAERILILDGGTATMMPRHSPVVDLLSLTDPDEVRSLHTAFLAAGANIIETNTFNANAISMSRYGLEDRVHAINVAAARIARAAVDAARRQYPGPPRFVAGALGPAAGVWTTGQPPAFEDRVQAFYDQASALAEGGVDCFLAETLTDLRTASAALVAFERCFQAIGDRLPVMISFAATEPTRTETPEDRVRSILDAVGDAGILTLGFNCGSGSTAMRRYMEALAAETRLYTSCYPSAGLPDAAGRYPRSPGAMASELGELARQGLLNMAGGCCGARPGHIRQIVKAVSSCPPRIRPGVTPPP